MRSNFVMMAVLRWYLKKTQLHVIKLTTAKSDLGESVRKHRDHTDNINAIKRIYH